MNLDPAAILAVISTQATKIIELEAQNVELRAMLDAENVQSE